MDGALYIPPHRRASKKAIPLTPAATTNNNNISSESSANKNSSPPLQAQGATEPQKQRIKTQALSTTALYANSVPEWADLWTVGMRERANAGKFGAPGDVLVSGGYWVSRRELEERRRGSGEAP